MKTSMRTALMTVCMGLSLSTFTTGLVYAQVEKAPSPPTYGHPPIDFVQLAQKKIENLKSKLNLETSQMSAWNAWAGKALENAKQRQNEMEKNRKDWGDRKDEGLTTPQRMDQQIERLQTRLAMLKDMKAATESLYSSLNKNQKTIFDLYWEKNGFHSRHMGPTGSDSPMVHQGMMAPPPPRPQ